MLPNEQVADSLPMHETFFADLIPSACLVQKSELLGLTVLPEALKQFENTSLETMSSFFWSSPEMFCSPARPVKLEMPALFTMDAICLHATAIDDSTTASSLSILPSCSSCQCMNWSKIQQDV